MNPLTNEEIGLYLAVPAKELRPYQLELLLDALRRRFYERGNPASNPASQPTMAEIATGWGVVIPEPPPQ